MYKDINIDLRQEFDFLKEHFAIDLLMIRSNKHSRCKCYDPLHRDGDRRCRVCGGTGKISSIEKISAIHQNVNASGFVKMTDLGLSVSNTIVLYFDLKAVPKAQDQVLIVGFDKYGSPVDIKKSCTIVSVQEVRGDNGRLEMYQVYAKYSPEKIDVDQKRLNSIPPAQKRDIAKGKRYIWPQK